VGTTTNTFEYDDGVNPVQTCSFDVTINDIEDPVITCPANVVVDNDPGVCGAVVNYTMPTATDNCSGSGSLTSLFAANNGGDFGGAVYFDVTVAGNNLIVNSLEVN